MNSKFIHSFELILPLYHLSMLFVFVSYFEFVNTLAFVAFSKVCYVFSVLLVFWIYEDHPCLVGSMFIVTIVWFWSSHSLVAVVLVLFEICRKKFGKK